MATTPARVNAPAAKSASTGGAWLPEGAPAIADVEGRRERHRRETFDRLVYAAREIMFDRRFSDMTVQDITDAADVGKGTFFNYFASKEHVVSRVQEYNRRTLVSAVDSVRVHEKTPFEALRDVIRWSLCPPHGEWLTYQNNTMRALTLNPEVRSLVAHELSVNRQSYEELTALGEEQGVIRSDLPSVDLAMVIQTFTAGLTVMLWIQGTTPTQGLVDDVMRKFCTLLEAPGPAAPAQAPRKRRAKPARRVAHRAAGRGSPAKRRS